MVGAAHRLGAQRTENADCFRRHEKAPLVCIEDIQWPDDVASLMTVRSSVLYSGRRAVVRYRGEASDRIYGLFPSENFEQVAAYFRTTYGAAEEQSLPMAVVGDPGARNRVLKWTRPGGGGAVFEIRQFDDLREMMPDQTHGVFRLYDEGGVPMFQNLLTTDFLMHRVRPHGS